jgi:response regulator NasT
VLVAAADQLVGAHLGAVLIGAGFEVVGHASDCRQAVVVTATVRPDLVVLEIGLPDPAASDALREMTDQTVAPVVLLTTPSRSGLIQGLVAGGSMACLVTPFVPASLLAAVDVVLALHADRGADLADAADLIRRLEEVNLVEQAKGVLMFYQQMTEAQAHRWLQQTAMHRRVRMTKVATDVIRRWVD